jgi:hypothetical protein
MVNIRNNKNIDKNACPGAQRSKPSHSPAEKVCPTVITKGMTKREEKRR